MAASNPASACLIVAADSGLQKAEAAGIRPRWIIGDMDSLDDKTRLEKYPPDCVLKYPPDKDFTDTELALRLLWEKGCDETWLIGGGGGRGDHFLGIKALFEREKPPDRWITAAEDFYCLKQGGEFSCPCKKGSIVSIFPLGEGPWAARSENLKWPLNNLVWDRGTFSLSNETAGDSFSVKAVQGRFLLALPFV
ncbi:thiamine pyrophosphokinase [Spirochaetia bacterium]|nr:thiamine pyrophosphokinase [Spirochaetia bacterium]